MRTLNGSQVRRSFAEVVESVGDRREVVVIVRYGRPIAAIVPVMRLTRNERAALGALKTTRPKEPVRRKPARTLHRGQQLAR